MISKDSMRIQDTEIPGLKIIHPKVFEDDRGYFFESYNEDLYRSNGINLRWVQDNQSKSKYGVIRGLHYQLNPFAQSKLIRVLQGKIYDIALDIRQGSPTFGKWFGLEISSDNKVQFLIPDGFAHGFSVLSNEAIVLYKSNNPYNPDSERGITYNDPELKINWKIPYKRALISGKDKVLPLFSDAEMNFKFGI